MKKLISLICVIAMLFAFAVTVSAAGESSLDIVKKSLDENSAVYDVVLTSDYYTSGISIYLDMADAIAKGATVTVAKVNAGKAQYVPNKKMVLVTYSPTDGSTLEPGETILATITFDMTNVAQSFTLGKIAEGTQTKTMFKYKDQDTTENVEYTSEVAYNYNVTVNLYEAPKTWVDQTPVTAQAGTYKNYEGVVVLTVDVALDAAAEKYGFDLTDGTNTKAFELTGLAGEGSVEYVVAFWGVPSDVTITATPKAYK